MAISLARRRRSWRASPTRPRRRPAGPCSPQASMSRPGGVAGRVGEHRPRVLAAGLVLPAPAHDLVDAAPHSVRVVGRPANGAATTTARGAERRAAVAEPELVGASSPGRAVVEVDDPGARRARRRSARRGRRRSCAPRRRRCPGSRRRTRARRRRPSPAWRASTGSATAPPASTRAVLGVDRRCARTRRRARSRPRRTRVGDQQVRAPPDRRAPGRRVRRERRATPRGRPRARCARATASGPPQRYVVSAADGTSRSTRPERARLRSDASSAPAASIRHVTSSRRPSHTSGIVVRSPAPSVSTTSPGRAIPRRARRADRRRAGVRDRQRGMRVEHRVQDRPGPRRPGSASRPRDTRR